jgi:nucleotide-binding universal stress UspA family protein
MRILCGTDLLPKTNSALDRAGMLAQQLGAELTLLHVAPPTESERMLEQDMERARERLAAHATPPLWHHGPSPLVCGRSGSAGKMLVAAARELDAALVVLGRHRQRPARDALAGTLAERLLSELTCPVLIVHRMPWHAYRNVLLALDCSKASGKAVKAAEALVLSSSARASVVHAYQPACEAIGLRDLLHVASGDPSRYELVIENAATTDAIQRVVGRLNPDLLVLGTRGRGRWRRALLGSVASRILASAKSDVLVVPGDLRASWRNARDERLALDVVPGI